MALFHFTTIINAPVMRVFDLSRSISLHKISMSGANERAVAGTISGLIKKDETVTWQAKHLFKTRLFTSKIISMQPPDFFIDEMIKGDFKSFKHEHHFKPIENGTIMIDKIEFECPYGFLGACFDKLYLKKYIQQLIEKRNMVIKEYAESGKWKAILD